jgi:hypothetical protein
MAEHDLNPRFTVRRSKWAIMHYKALHDTWHVALGGGRAGGTDRKQKQSGGQRPETEIKHKSTNLEEEKKLRDNKLQSKSTIS